MFFSPAGWDNEKKIAILYENMHSVNPDQYYTDVIARPIVRKVLWLQLRSSPGTVVRKY
jgi:dynein light intermediate chain 1